MESRQRDEDGGTNAGKGEWRALWITVFMAGLSVVLMALPTPAGLSVAGQRVLAVAVMAIGLWCTDAIPAAVTGILLIIALVLSRGVPGFPEALVGFAEPVAYFLIGVLTIGMAVLQSGLAERVARFFLRRCGGSSRALYLEMLLSFPLLTLLLPSATTRTGILIFVYEQALDLGHVPRGAPLAKAIMLALGSINRLASTVLLTGGITPVLAASLIGGISWGRWLALMCVPYGILLALGAVLIYWLYRKGFHAPLSPLPTAESEPLSGKEIRTLAITLGASLLWLTDAWHHWNPALPAILAWACLLTPGNGVLSWKEFERGFGWANFFVIASSLSLARALASSGAGSWIAETLVRGMPVFSQQPILVVVVLLLAAALLRLLIP
ncbi:MAG: SLC13 family permease, partial [Pseudomonadota bacterium]